MDCRSVRKLLPAYLESEVASGERADIEAHLSSCAACATVAEELRKTVGYVQNLDQVEPPEWLTQKIMTRIRAEEPAPRKSLFERIFGAWPAKVPLGALATVLIAVCTVYVYKAIQPDVTLEVRKESPQVSTPAHVEKQGGEPAGPPKEKAEGIRMRPREATKAMQPRAPLREDSAQSGQGVPAPVAPAASAMPEPAPPIMKRSADKADESVMRERFGASSYEREVFKSERKARKAEAPAAVGGAGREPVFTMRVADPGVAVAQVRDEVRRAGGLLIDQRDFTLTAEIPVQRVPDFLSRLRQIGTMDEKQLLPSGETVRLKIRIEALAVRE